MRKDDQRVEPALRELDSPIACGHSTRCWGYRPEPSLLFIRRTGTALRRPAHFGYGLGRNVATLVPENGHQYGIVVGAVDVDVIP